MTTYAEPPTCTVPLKPCPDWCILPTGHGWDSYSPDTGLHYRGHAAAYVWNSISVGADEASDGRMTFNYHLSDNDELTIDQLRDAAREITEAAKWLEEHR